MKKIFLIFYKFLIFLSVIAGVISIYELIDKKRDYNLLFIIEDQNKIIENNTNLDNLKIIYKDIQVKSLYGTKIKILNNGKKAITKDFIFDPIIINVDNNNKLVSIISSSAKREKDNIKVIFDLLNPQDSLDMYILTTQKPTFTLKYKIQEITNIKQWNKVTHPPMKDKFFTLSTILFFLLMLLSILLTIDAFILIGKGDYSFGNILNTIKNIQTDKNFNKEKFLQKLSEQYEEYIQSLPYIFIKKDYLISRVSEKIDQLDTSNEKDRYILYKYTNMLIRNGNLYNIRSLYIIVGPILFIIFLLGFIYNLLF